MKRLFFAFIVLITCICSCKGNLEEKALRSRFEGYLKAVSGMNNDSIKVYTYPKLFSILPDSQSKESMEKPYDMMRGLIGLDSITTDSIFPVIHVDNGSYAKAIYSVTIRMTAGLSEADTDGVFFESANKDHSTKPTAIEHSISKTYPAPQSTLMVALFRSQFNVEVLSCQVKNRVKIMRVKVMAIAAKDQFAKEWSFLTVTNDNELLNKLFPKKVLEKMAAKD